MYNISRALLKFGLVALILTLTGTAIVGAGTRGGSGGNTNRAADPNLPGGGATVKVSGVRAFSLPAPGISEEEHLAFIVGNSIFRTNWVQAPSSVSTLQGLGPLFNTRSCASCHQQDGRGRPPEGDEEFVGLLLRISVPSAKDPNVMEDVPNYGDQIQSLALDGIPPEATPKVHYTEVSGKFSDGEIYTLAQPHYSLENPQYGELPKDLRISPRVGPQMIGLGLIEAIPEAKILELADPDDRNEDGVSGRPNWLMSNGKKAIGRLGWKANKPSLLEQGAGALLGDLGITSPLHPEQNCMKNQAACRKAFAIEKNEISMQDLQRLTTYMKLLAVPQRRDIEDPEVVRGERLFNQINCQSCHHQKFQTGVDPDFKVLSQQWIYPYTDLLLHDMGEGLADNRPDGEASGQEWKTPPLWGIGLIPDVNRHQRLLHDGRARGVQEAILWHGGEGQAAKEKFIALKRSERAALVKFVNSL